MRRSSKRRAPRSPRNSPVGRGATMGAIVTLTMNPALDIATSTDRVVPTHKLRCAPPRYDPGGGGINVARAVHALGGDAVAIFPVGGPAGEMIRHLLDEEGVLIIRSRSPGSPAKASPSRIARPGSNFASSCRDRRSPARIRNAASTSCRWRRRRRPISSPAAACRSASPRISMREWPSSRSGWESAWSWIPPAPRSNRPARASIC